MANYAGSNLAVYQAKLLAGFQSGALKSTDPQVLKLFLAQGASNIPLTEGRTREDRTLTAYFKKRASRSLGSARSHNHTGTQGDSDSITPSWAVYADTIAISLKQGSTNLFDYNEMLMNDLLNSFKNFEEGMENVAQSYLFAQRSGVNIASVDGKFNLATDVYEIEDDANTVFGKFNNRAFSITQMVMQLNKWYTSYTVVCDSIAYSKFQAQAAQGVSNSTNLSFQFSGVTFIHATGFNTLFTGLNANYGLGAWVVIPDGTIAAGTWIPEQNRMGVSTSVNKYGTIINPNLGMTLATHEYETRVDGTATNGYTQDVRRELQLSVDAFFEHAPLSVANESPIQAFAIVDTLTP